MHDDLLSALRTHFGHRAFRPGQAEAVGALLGSENVLVVMPTGAGKSLVYQLAALQLGGLALVISPLIALMEDQVAGLARHGVPATCIHSSLVGGEQARRLRALSGGAYRLAYVAPERLRSTAFLQALSGLEVSLLAVDEAHCISQWGHDFRPDFLRLAAARAALGGPVTAALTATATPRVQDDIVQLLGLPRTRRVITGFNRPNLAFGVRYATGPAGKLRALRELLAGHEEGGAIVYVGTRRDAEEVAEFVRNVAGIEAGCYHAGLEPAERARVQDAFLGGRLPVVVATNAFGLGVDRPDVRLVAHYGLPATLEAYYQEAGRAGRDGQPAQAVLLYSPKDRALQEWFIDNDAPTVGEVRRLHRALGGGGEETWRTPEELSLATGLPEIRLRVALAQLEAAGSLARLGDAGVRMLLSVGPWNEAAVRSAAAGVEERRARRRAQLEAMIAYAEADTCRRRILLDHFGDSGPAEAALCCDNCLAAARAQGAASSEAGELAPGERAALIILDAVRRLKWGVGRGKLAQVLAGSRAKEMQAMGYCRHPYYGRLAVFTQREIEDLLGQLIASGYLRPMGGEQPVLRLTPLAEGAIQARAALPLSLPRRVEREAVQRKVGGEALQGKEAVRKAAQAKAVRREPGATVAETGELFARGITIAEIARQRGLKESTVYAHLAQLIDEGKVPLEAVVPWPLVERVREAIEAEGSAERLAPLKARLPEDISYGVIRCVVAAYARRDSTAEGAKDAKATAPDKGAQSLGDPGALSGESSSSDPEIEAFLSRDHPRPLAGPWQEGWALGFHSRYAGDEWGRSAVGALTYRLKYEGDPSALEPLAEQAAALCAQHPRLAAIDAIVPVPPTAGRPFDPVRALAEALGQRLDRPVLAALAKTRRTAPQKEMRTLPQKRANVAGAFAVRGDVRGQALLVVDDLYDSGATLAEVTRVLRAAGAAQICVLTLTRTIHSDV